ncbi:MAG TPA: Do family serine endopeptidase [Syntrophorhabdaceae bacterium]|nr:Do family serine endopeptidase [Syntrophorhabdaceae bacterium]
MQSNLEICWIKRIHIAALTVTLVVLLVFYAAGTCAAATAEDLTTAFVRVAKEAIPAVVHVEVTERREVANPLLPFENDPFYRYFFGGPKMPKKFKQEVKGLGTGMIMDAQGHILTNYHVAGGATKIEVQLSTGQRYTARLIGGDPKTDLAVISIDTKERLPFVKFGNSDKMEVGQWVVAIGAPRGLDQTVTQGIISAKHRTGITDPTSYQDFLQTDAAINPGNSGGPLLNLQGEVIGVNSAIASSSGGFEGIGFAIPSNIAVHIGRTLIAHGKVERGWLGVSVGDITYEQAQSFGMSVPKGAHVEDVMKDSPAARAGLKKGDVITVFDNKEVANSSELRNQVAVTPIGSTVNLTVLRDHKPYVLSVKIGNLDDATKTLLTSVESKLGAGFRPTTASEQDKYSLSAGQGVAVTRVDPKGPLGESGFEKDDIIVEVNGQAVAGMESFVGMINTLEPKRQATFLAIDHNTGNSGYVAVTIK